MVLLLPSAWLAWEYRDMPQLGWPHDDGIYFAGAKSIAAGQGHTIPHLPGAPAQTKYPPLYPLLLAPVWWLAPQFPQNLPIATLFAWLAVPPMLWLCLLLFRRLGFPEWAGWTMTAMLAINPYLTLFGRSLRSEIPFTVLLLGAVLVAGRSAPLAGLMAGLSYLTRTAGLPLLLGMPLVYASKRQWREAVLFTLTMLPFVAGWAFWQREHKPGGEDPYILYYLDYVWYEFYNVDRHNLLTVLYENLDVAIGAMAVPVLPFIGNFADKMLAQALAIGSVIGVVRLAREREDARAYAVYALLSSVMLVMWHVPPNGRFFFPIFPLLLAGFFTECKQVSAMLQSAYRSGTQRRAALAFASVLLILFGYTVWNNVVLAAEIAPEGAQQEIRMTRDMTACATRIESELPRDAAILTDNDPLLYLQTGRTAMRLVPPAKELYGDVGDRAVVASLPIAEVGRSHNMRYYLMHREYARNLDEDELNRYNAAIDADPNLRLLFRCGGAAVYEIADPITAKIASP